jgi:assimilatory nitrate reductase catalytic subunit
MTCSGDAFVAMHWGGRFTGGIGTNALTVPVIDPHSKQPELKHAAVRIEPFVARWRGAFAAPATPERKRVATASLARFDYATLSLAEGPEILLRLELASAGEPDRSAYRAGKPSASRRKPTSKPSSPGAPVSR